MTEEQISEFISRFQQLSDELGVYLHPSELSIDDEREEYDFIAKRHRQGVTYQLYLK